MRIPEVIRVLRGEAGLTQHGLAQAAGLTQHAVSQYESGLRKPTYASLTQLSIAFNLDLKDRAHLLSLGGYSTGGQRIVSGRYFTQRFADTAESENLAPPEPEPSLSKVERPV